MRRVVLGQRAVRTGKEEGLVYGLETDLETIHDHLLLTIGEYEALQKLLNLKIKPAQLLLAKQCRWVRQTWQVERDQYGKFSCTHGTRHEFDEKQVWENLTDLKNLPGELKFESCQQPRVFFFVKRDALEAKLFVMRTDSFTETHMFFPDLASFFYAYETGEWTEGLKAYEQRKRESIIRVVDRV
jgi:hypothetical protein